MNREQIASEIKISQRLNLIQRVLRIRKARSVFYEYCRLKQPKFYSPDKIYLKDLCDTLQALYEGRIIRIIGAEANQIVTFEELEELNNSGIAYNVIRKLIINMPPRFGKSRTLELFTEWVLGKNKELKYISVSYNSILSGIFAKDVRDDISETSEDERYIIYHDVFPETKIKKGDAAKQKWSLEGSHFTYLATSFEATITGIGCNIGVVDDPVRSSVEAYNILKLDTQWEWYKNTYLSRLEELAFEIVAMTRWANEDLTGRLLQEEPGEWHHVVYEAKTPAGEMLAESVMSLKSYERKKSLMDEMIFDANYHQKPINRKGTVYSRFNLYNIKNIIEDGTNYIVLHNTITNIEIKRIKLKIKNSEDERTKYDLFEEIVAYCDTADEGDDYLCLIIAGILNGQAYILAVHYSQRPQEETEGESARLLFENKCARAKFESNKGGKQFARMVESLLWTAYKSRECSITWFHQGENKVARILSNSTWVMNNIFYPADWNKKWPKFYTSIIKFQKEGENQHDDAEDALTGLAEMVRGGDIVHGTDDEADRIEQYFKDING